MFPGAPYTVPASDKRPRAPSRMLRCPMGVENSALGASEGGATARSSARFSAVPGAAPAWCADAGAMADTDMGPGVVAPVEGGTRDRTARYLRVCGRGAQGER